ncbi:MAG: pyridoxamine 5'-phosphate oxidase family protein [Chloroflexi bacterium]|nr:MAG: pyridoxamine 5'-phosphate oxidase family protein [Chloroflexota bacterium]
MNPKSASEIPAELVEFLRQGAPALLLTVGEDGYPHTAMTWAAARDSQTIRFGADIGGTTLANLERESRASLQIIGPNNLLFIVKGPVRQVKARIEAALFPIAMMELSVAHVKEQSWLGVVVSALA